MTTLFKEKMIGAIIATALLIPLTAFSKTEPTDVLISYADIAHAGFEDSLITAKVLQQAISTFVAAPSESTMTAAKEAWIKSRVPYQQTEVYRFGNSVVDEWEGKVNAWPLDEGLIDYVDSSVYGQEPDENPLYTANLIANSHLKIAGKDVDASTISKALLQDSIQEADEIEANVATGYHAIEFLLWGQDLNGTKAGAGARKATDYDTKNCTHKNCDRRASYLSAVTELLVDDLSWMTEQWAIEGEARKNLLSGDVKKGLSTIFTGMGSLSYGELGGERMKLGLMLHDPEEEHDCFSDNTHNSHFYDAKGIQNIYNGSYTRIDGTVVSGASISDIVAEEDTDVDIALQSTLESTMEKMSVLVKTANAGEAYDQMIADGNSAGNKKVLDAVNALTTQTKAIEKAVSILGLSSIEFEGSDSLDSPDKVDG
jgi:putative iron-regulated protein